MNRSCGEAVAELTAGVHPCRTEGTQQHSLTVTKTKFYFISFPGSYMYHLKDIIYSFLQISELQPLLLSRTSDRPITPKGGCSSIVLNTMSDHV